MPTLDKSVISPSNPVTSKQLSTPILSAEDGVVLHYCGTRSEKSVGESLCE